MSTRFSDVSRHHAATRLVLAVVGSVTGLILALPAVLIMLPFLIMSTVVRRFAELTEPRVASGEELMQFDPFLAWVPKQDLNTHYSVPDDDIYPIVTDSDGWPGHTTLSDSDMVVVGDSFVTGYGARAGEAFWAVAPDLRIKPIGCPGYDMVQEVLAMGRVAGQLRGKLVTWFVCLENDIADSLQPHLRGYRKPFVHRSHRTGEWAIVSEHVRPERWRHSGAADVNNRRILAALCSPSPLAEHYFGACRFLISQAADVCRENDATLVVVTLPTRDQLDPDGCRTLASLVGNPEEFDADRPDRRLAEICGQLGVPFVPAKKCLAPADYKRFETYHWTPRGHRKVAALLRDIRDTFGLRRRGSDRMGIASTAVPTAEAAN